MTQVTDHETDKTADAIVIEGLTNRFGTHVVHDDLNLTVKRGEVLGIVGGSGAGKTVLLNSILGLQRPVAGKIRIFGKSLDDASDAEAQTIRAKTGVLFQGGALFSTLSVAENIMAPILEFTHLSPKEAHEIARHFLGIHGLEGRLVGRGVLIELRHRNLKRFAA